MKIKDFNKENNDINGMFRFTNLIRATITVQETDQLKDCYALISRMGNV